MRLELDLSDLKEGQADIACSATTFDDFSEEAQKAIKVVGQATFYHRKGEPNEAHKTIYPPES